MSEKVERRRMDVLGEKFRVLFQRLNPFLGKFFESHDLRSRGRVSRGSKDEHSTVSTLTYDCTNKIITNNEST